MEILDYNQVTSGIKSYSEMGKTIMISPASSYYIYNSVTNKVNIWNKFVFKISNIKSTHFICKNKLVSNKQSPIKSMKAVKTEIEIKNFRECQVTIFSSKLLKIKIIMWI